MHTFMVTTVISRIICIWLFTMHLHLLITQRMVCCMYNKYTVRILNCLKLTRHDSKGFNLVVYLTALF
jgi:hypothetical protein